MARSAAGKRRGNVVGRLQRDFATNPIDRRTEMGREQRVRMQQQSRLDRTRPGLVRPVLHFEYVGRVTAEPAPFEGIRHGTLVDDRSPPDIDEQRIELHVLERIATDQVQSIGRERNG
jgi:hypothetical protein